MNVVPEIIASTPQALDIDAVRSDFPALAQVVNGRPVVYLDSAASAQKPRAVIDAVTGAYSENYANVHRGVHTLSQRATDAYERARSIGRRYLGAPSEDQVVFVRGTTEAINLVAQSFLRPLLEPGDEVLVTEMEHHSNIVPWQLVCEEAGARVVAAPIDDRGALDLDAFESLLRPQTKMVSVVHVSNALGTINPVADIVRMARARGIPTLVDGAQAAPHMAIDVDALGCDFYTLSGHKVFGPTGIGLLFGRRELLLAMRPYQGGGEMIRSVSFAGSTWAEPPHRFEAGTPNIVGAIGLGAALEYVQGLGLDAISAHEAALLAHASACLSAVPQVRFIGTAPDKASVVSFVVEGIHAHDVGTILDADGVAVRAGNHCAQPAIEHFGLSATARASFALYNTLEEADRLAQAVRHAVEIFSR